MDEFHPKKKQRQLALAMASTKLQIAELKVNRSQFLSIY